MNHYENMNHKRILISLLITIFTLLGNCASSQIQLKGKIIDSESKAPLNYVNIFVSEKNSKGTISNLNGEFVIDSLEMNDIINFSFVGYKTTKIEVLSSDMENIIIELKPETYNLNEIIVEHYTAKSLIKEAYNRIKYNYPSRYNIFEGLYRKQIYKNKESVFLGDCTMKIKTPLYKQSKNRLPKCKVTDKRFSEKRLKTDNNYTLDANGTIFLYPDYIYPVSKLNDNIQTKLSKQYITEAGETIYKIVFENRDVNEVIIDKGYFFVNVEDKAILSVHRKQKINDIQSKAITLTNSYFIFDVFYKKVEGSYQFNYGRSSWSFDKLNEDDSEIDKYDVVIDFLVRDRNIEKGKGRFKSLTKDPFLKLKDALTVPFSELNEILPDYEQNSN